MIAKIKYFDKELPRLRHIGGAGKSAWIDVRATRVEINGKPIEFGDGYWVEYDEQGVAQPKELENVVGYQVGDELKVYLGFAIDFPEGYEAYTAPRGSTFKNFGLIQTNSWGVVDLDSFKGDGDEWFIPYFALKSGYIKKFDRVGQFRVIETMPEFSFEEVEVLGNEDRGSHGSTGTN